MIFQKTLKQEISLEGIGVHSGQTVRMKIKPALPGQGIVFTRSDIKDSPVIAAHYINVVDTRLATTLGRGKVTISTVEHVLAALSGMGVDNAVIEVDNCEIPIMDGSSKVFCEAIEKVGLQSQLQDRSVLAVRRRVEVKHNEKWAVAEPCNHLEIHASIEWDHPSIGYQEFRYIEGITDFSELSHARTFGFLSEVEALKKMGLARGGSLENAVVLDDALVLNPEGLRCPDEFVRHKVLDALGDFKLAGISIHAFMRLHRAGHEVHSELLKAIFADAKNYEIITATAPAPIREAKPARVRMAAARRFATT